MNDDATTMSPEAPSTRQRILIAAATMLGENPTARLSVRAVAARAGVSTGSLRHFFPTQRALIDTVVAGLYDLELPEDPMSDRSMPEAPVDESGFSRPTMGSARSRAG